MYAKKIRNIILSLAAAAAVIAAAVLCAGALFGNDTRKTPDELILEYMSHISEKEYEQMFEMTDMQKSDHEGMESFIERNSAIYEGIDAHDINIELIECDKSENSVKYSTVMGTSAGNISFDNKAYFTETDDGYRLIWNDSLIFPELEKTDNVRVTFSKAKRGEITDRNDWLLAGQGEASSVGAVPGKLENREQAAAEIAGLLNIDAETIERKLSAGWVRDDLFVPLKTLPKVDNTGSESLVRDESADREYERQAKLLEIPGVMISSVTVRSYPFGKAASHLTGYVQNVTAEDLETHPDEGYDEYSVIGRSGLESLYEDELRGRDGCRIFISNRGTEKYELAYLPVQNGRNIKLTVDASLQNALYEQFKDDKGCSAAIDPYTGEVLALVSTPSYDSNAFIMGMTSEEWSALNDDESNPLYNRFRQRWCPGSSFKPAVAAAGLDSGTLDPDEDFGNEGLRWRKDTSWGSYYVTTLHAYEPAILDNALIYSDNIYFAKAALKMGAEIFQSALDHIGFSEKMPFEISMAESQYSNTGSIGTEIQLADSGYGQGQVLVNPLHLACIYTAFCNSGNMLKPYISYSGEGKGEYWIEGAFSADAANRVLEGIIKSVNDPDSNGYAAHRGDVTLAGKTGTAEIKVSKDDSTGTELGWFAVMTADRETDRPILIVTMIEDVKNRGGSNYVVKKISNVLDIWFG